MDYQNLLTISSSCLSILPSPLSLAHSTMKTYFSIGMSAMV